MESSKILWSQLVPHCASYYGSILQRSPIVGTDSKKEKVIFDAATEFESRAERDAYVSRACGDDKKLLAGVQALLKYHDSSSFLDAPILEPDVTLDDSPISEGSGTVIGRYKLLEKIGEGGMAVVYMAEQTEPIRRKVALKIIKLGMDTKSVIARFEAERQALALMDHPSIAKVLDAGATETGRPYFVMELVKGVSITDYCDANSLSTKERLELFIQVCNAVQHAHQKGIIHRDIKPTNVMVTLHDGKPVPKVIDFGIAKAINQKLTEKTLFTRYAHIIGTPAYMSPEQAELSDLDIDTRTDIYSLGVLLYELLTGTPPFGEEELRKAGYIEMQRVIREQEPVKPSTRIRTAQRSMGVPPMSGASWRGRLALASRGRPGLAILKNKGRMPSPQNMGKMPMLREVRGDLDWIVMKSLEKDRARRYETANGLATDIQRHIEHEPVVARGPSPTYRLQKFLRRHRSQTIAALAIAAVAGSMTVIFSMWNRDRLQLTEAASLRHKAILSQAREQYAKADRDAALDTIKPILDSRHVGPEAQLLQAGILVDNRRSDEAATLLRNLLNERAEIAGAAHSLLARILYESESPNAETLKQAEQHRQKAEARLPKTAEAYFLRAMFAITVKDQFAALNEALELDLQHYESRRLRAYTYYASRKYEQMRDDALAMTILRPRDPLGYSLRAIALRELGKYAEAITEYDNAIGLLTKGGPQYIDLSTQRCETLLRMGDYKRVITDAQECLKLSPEKPASVAGILPAIRGRDALDTPLQYYIFSALTALGEYEKAEAVFRQIIRSGQESRFRFEDWRGKYVFDTLAAGRSWHPPGSEPAGAVFLPMVEAEETYRSLSAKARCVIRDCFGGQWSPDGKKLAFSLGVQGYSGVALFDPATQETDLLIVPGKDPKWSPDGKFIAFVRDCQALRVEELATAERRSQGRALADEEIWIMNADGTEPRRLAAGGYPSWGQDSTCVYYQSRVDQTFNSISIVDRDAKPRQITACSYSFPSVSPDGRRVVYQEDGFLRVKDLDSQGLVAEWPMPSTMAMPEWSPTGDELCVGMYGGVWNTSGLWIYRFDRREPVKVLDGPMRIRGGTWAADGTTLVFHLGPPYFETWTADLDPNVSIIEALAPAQTLQEHWRQMVRLCTRRVETDPLDAAAYCDRAGCYDRLHERAKAGADMRRWSAAASGRLPCDFRRVIDMPFNCEIVFSAERPVNLWLSHEIPVLNVALGQKGRCKMKSFQIPMMSMSLLGLCLLSGLETPTARADFTFGAPADLDVALRFFPNANVFVDGFPSDGLEMFMDSDRAGGQGWDIWVLKRAAPGDDWGPPENLGPAVNSSSGEAHSSISGDGLELYFASNRPGGYGNLDFYVTRRATRTSPWGPPTNLGPKVNSSFVELGASVSSDGLELYFCSNRSGGYGSFDLYLSKRSTAQDLWGDPVNLGPAVNSPSDDRLPCLSPDGLLLLFQSYRPGGYGGFDIWMTRRGNRSAPWEPPVNLGPIINSPESDIKPRLAPDGSALYFAWDWSDRKDRPWKAPIIPIVDFNGDGKVDGKDVLHMVSHWATDDPLCDIGPFAWGDGTVGLEDLTVLAGYLGKDVTDPTLIAHWTFDETEGNAARESVGDSSAIVLGSPLWQPAGGQVDGALQLDGVDDCVIASLALDPAKGPFSVLAWVKGGASGQVVISEPTGANWLMADAEGKLRTELQGLGRMGGPLQSQIVISDGQWHRIGLVWDGSRRMLYVDGVVAAEDTQSALPSSGNGLYIGAGKGMEPGTFWSGLIDDVRIYSRAVRP